MPNPNSLRLLAASAVAVAAACTGTPTELCACSQPPPEYRAVGTVTTASGQPVAGARISARVMMPTCAENTAAVVPYEASQASTAADGTYSFRFYGVHATRDQCVRIVAHRTATDSTASAPTLFQLAYEGGVPAPRTVDLVFP